jgi:hypothetical protein
MTQAAWDGALELAVPAIAVETGGQSFACPRVAPRCTEPAPPLSRPEEKCGAQRSDGPARNTRGPVTHG